MNFGKLFAYTIIALSFAASIGYFFKGDVRLGAYWFFAGCITLSVTV